MRTVRWTIIALALLMTLAGCLKNGPTTSSTPPDLATAPDTRTLLAGSLANLTPDSGLTRIALDITMASQVSAQTAKISLFVDSATNETLLHMEGQTSGQLASFTKDGVTVYAQGESVVLLLGKNATVLHDANATHRTGNKPLFDTSGFSGLGGGALGGGGLANVLGGASNLGNLSITSGPTPTLFEGQAAWKVGVKSTDAKTPGNGTLTLYAAKPMRPAQIVFDGPVSGLNGKKEDGHIVATFHYGDAAKATVPEAATRAAAIAWTSDAPRFGAGCADASCTSDAHNETLTFVGAGGIALAELEARIGEPHLFGPGDTPPLLTLPLAQKTKDSDAFTVTFTDKDADGKLSKGDTLRVFAKDRTTGEIAVALYDVKTGTLVTPGFAGLATVAALAAATIALARRR